MDRRVYDNYVLRVAEQGSLTKAAAALGISQPALSSGISALEKELGTRIFNRRTVPVSFTPEGEIYRDYLLRLRIMNADLTRRIRELHEETNSRIRIGAPVVYVESVLSDAVLKLRKSDPEYGVLIKSSPLPELIEMSNRGEIDCFISTSAALPENFEICPIGKETIRLCVPKAYSVNRLIAREQRETPDYAALDGCEFIFLEEDQPLQKQAVKFFNEYGIRPKSHITVDQVSAAVGLSLRGEGICFASGASLECNTDLSTVCIYPLPESISGRELYVARDREIHLSEACEKLILLLTNDDPGKNEHRKGKD